MRLDQAPTPSFSLIARSPPTLTQSLSLPQTTQKWWLLMPAWTPNDRGWPPRPLSPGASPFLGGSTNRPFFVHRLPPCPATPSLPPAPPPTAVAQGTKACLARWWLGLPGLPDTMGWRGRAWAPKGQKAARPRGPAQGNLGGEGGQGCVYGLYGDASARRAPGGVKESRFL